MLGYALYDTHFYKLIEKGLTVMNMKHLVSILVVWVISLGAAQATIIDFNLAGAGFVQDSPVAENYFAAQDLNLSSGVITACGGTCISTPAGVYTGTITGSFISNVYSYLSFDAVMNNAVIDLYDSANNLISTLSAGAYTYSGSVGIASFSAALNYDGLYSLTIDKASAVPEPASLVLLGLGLAGIGFSKRKKA